MIDGQTVALAWRGHYVAALFEESGSLAAKLENKGFDVVILGANEAAWAEPTSSLAKLLGRAL